MNQGFSSVRKLVVMEMQSIKTQTRRGVLNAYLVNEILHKRGGGGLGGGPDGAGMSHLWKWWKKKEPWREALHVLFQSVVEKTRSMCRGNGGGA